MEDPQLFQDAFAKAWFKLTHRDLGPRSRYLGDEVPNEIFDWQDPLPEKSQQPLEEEDIDRLKKMIEECGLSIRERVYAAWSSASTYRDSDKRGGANGSRIRLAPQNGWEANMPDRLSKVLQSLEAIRKRFHKAFSKEISMADMIVLAGSSAIEEAAKRGGYEVEVSFVPGRVDAEEGQTDERAFSWLEPMADGFRNYQQKGCSVPAEYMLLDKAQLLTLTLPQMSVLVAGLRVLGATYQDVKHGVFTDCIECLSNDFFVNLLDMDIEWRAQDKEAKEFIGYDRESGREVWHATRADLVFGANAQLRAQAEFYAQDDNREKFVRDFVAAWEKVMLLDRFDLQG